MADPSQIRYRAFLSYSHRDEQWGTWLHRALERTRIAKDLVGRDTPYGAVPQTLRPIFRDRDDYSPGESLSAKTRAALAASDFLIVVCSPNSARSQYCNEEIRLFKAMGREGRILPVIVDGEPGDPDQDCFSPALRFKVDADGRVTDQREEPLAADARPQGDGRDGAHLKLVAGLLGLALDEIVRRAERERRRVLRMWIGGLLVIAAGFAGLGFFAEINRREAAHQRDTVLVSQAQHVAQRSRLIADRGDAATALALALEVLPVSGDDRPRVKVADDALTYALGRLRERMILRGHEKSIWSATFSPDGAKILTSSEDATMRLWDAASGKTLASFKVDASAQPVFSPDGKRFAAGDKVGKAYVWRTDLPVEPIVLEGHNGEVLSVAFSPDGERLLTSSYDRTARVWHLPTAQVLAELRGHEKELGGAWFSPDGKTVATASYDNTARLWPADGNGTPIVLRGHDNYLVQAAFSPDGKRLATTSLDGTARLWDVATGKEIATMRGHSQSVGSVTFSPDGSRILTAGDDNLAGVWSGETGQSLSFLRGHEGSIMTVEFSRDGAWMLTASADGSARIWTTKGFGQLAILRSEDGAVNGASFSPDALRVATAGADGTLRLWQGVELRDAIAIQGTGKTVKQTAFSGDGTRLATVSDDGEVALWDATNGTKVGAIHTPMTFPLLWRMPTGVRLVTSDPVKDRGDSWHNAIRITDIATGEVLHSWPIDVGKDEPIAISPDGALLVTNSLEGESAIWDSKSGKRLRVLEGSSDTSQKAWFSKDGSMVVGTHSDGAARVWVVKDGREIATIRPPKWAITHASFSPDGKRIAAVSYDGAGHVWDVATGRLLLTLTGNEGNLTTIAFSDDGAWLVASSTRASAAVWESATGRLMAELRGHRDIVGAASFSPDGKSIATGSWDGKTILWRFVHGDDAIARACQLMPRALTLSQREEHFFEREPKVARCGRKPGQ